jgi:hypothetical protein
MGAISEDAGTWYYVVDCATCNKAIPFRQAPSYEDDSIIRWPTMRVRCVHCHTDQTYAGDLISRRKAAAPRWIFARDRAPSHASDGDREAFRDRQEDRRVGDSSGRVIFDREIDPISSSLRNILIVAVSGRRATIFFLSSCFLVAGSVLRLALETFYPVPLAVLNESSSSGPALLLGNAFFGALLFGLVLFIFGIGTFFVEACGGLKTGQDWFDRLCRQTVEHLFGTVKAWMGGRTSK